jgi:hypothetical protein
MAARGTTTTSRPILLVSLDDEPLDRRLYFVRRIGYQDTQWKFVSVWLETSSIDLLRILSSMLLKRQQQQQQ